MDTSEFERFVASKRRAKRLPVAPAALIAGEVVPPVRLDARQIRPAP